QLIDAFDTVDAVLEEDRLWFDSNPSRTLRFRRATEAEIEIEEECGRLAALPPGRDRITVVFRHSGRTLAWVLTDFYPDFPLECLCEEKRGLLVRTAGRHRFPESVVQSWELALFDPDNVYGFGGKSSPIPSFLPRFAAATAKKPAEPRSRP